MVNVTRNEVATAAHAFLERVTLLALDQEQLRQPTIKRAYWWKSQDIAALPRGNGAVFEDEYETFDSDNGDAWIQLQLLHSDLDELVDLKTAIERAGIQPNEIDYGWIMPLARRWMNETSPLDSATWDDSLIQGFASAVVNKKEEHTLRIALANAHFDKLPIRLEEGVVIRNITRSELREFGAPQASLVMERGIWPSGVPWDHWPILEVKHDFDETSPFQISESANAFITLAALIAPFAIQVTNLGISPGWGFKTSTWNPIGSVLAQVVHRTQLVSFDAAAIEQLTDVWSRFRGIMSTSDHYLRMPAIKHFEGSYRIVDNDGLLDHAMGLEGLLSHGTQGEASYRFRLRGATILGQVGESRPDSFDQLRRFYEVRSDLAHGRANGVTAMTAQTTREFSEETLRKIWWWFYGKDFDSLEAGTKFTDDMIIGRTKM